MRTVINIYIGNLALADCIIAVFCIPFQFQAALLQKWNLPFFMCKLCPFVQVSEDLKCKKRVKLCQVPVPMSFLFLV